MILDMLHILAIPVENPNLMLSLLEGDADSVHVSAAVHIVFDLIASPLRSEGSESVVMMGVVVAALAGGVHVAMRVALSALGGIGDGLAYVFDGRLDLVPDEGHVGCVRSVSREGVGCCRFGEQEGKVMEVRVFAWPFTCRGEHVKSRVPACLFAAPMDPPRALDLDLELPAYVITRRRRHGVSW